MKNIAICYGENAIKISDSYCSGHSNHAYSNSSHLMTPSIQNSVTSIYKIKISTENKQFLVRLTWCNPLNRGFSVSIFEFPFSISKFGKSFKLLRKERGARNFEFGSFRFEIIWDLSRAKYDCGPEPISGFYVLVLVNSELSLILGDMEKLESDVKKRVSEARLSEFSLISRCEHFSGNALFSTRARFCETGIYHDILIKCCGEDEMMVNNPVLSVYVDKKNVIEVKRLQWNFRGNQSIFLDGLLVDLMWDVHDWCFGPKSGYAVFLFRTRRGLDSRLWLEEKSFEQNDQEEKVGFSFLICACKKPD
ncbi:hypothetical protein DH2020_018061 [Rehmannia glutinosa]|uniref:DUF868 domain-containing protein n=1 Tax=Rehmannia glutinosa TaxID=99300 RepID=A0ABR0WLB2_REHGL